MFNRIKKELSWNLQSTFGQKVDKKIVVFESDDWGGIRMPSKTAYNSLCTAGVSLANDHFNRLDTNASLDDLTALYEVLQKHIDSNGHHPAFTFNVTTGNPDFEKIEQRDFTTFLWEPFYKTMERVNEGSFQLWKDGIKAGLMFPQYHGRDHVHRERWLESLRMGETQVLEAFKQGVFGIVTTKDTPEYFMAAYDSPDGENEAAQQQSIVEGLQIFHDAFGFMPKSFIPPCYIASQSLLDILKDKNVIALQGKIIHLLPKGIVDGKRTYEKHFRKAGYNVKNQGVNLVRNCFFEPSSKPKANWVADCLHRIEIAFRWGKPAIIDTHRVNYIGSLVEQNRTDNLNLLDELLSKMLKKWKDITFMNSQQLVDFYIANHG